MTTEEGGRFGVSVAFDALWFPSEAGGLLVEVGDRRADNGRLDNGLKAVRRWAGLAAEVRVPAAVRRLAHHVGAAAGDRGLLLVMLAPVR